MRNALRLFFALALASIVFDSALAWNVRQATRANERNFIELSAGGYNQLTGSYDDERYGNTAATYRGTVWCSLPTYAGHGYVVMMTRIGRTVVRIDAQRYPSIYKDLVSGDVYRIEEALLLVEGSAIMQGLIPMPRSEGD